MQATSRSPEGRGEDSFLDILFYRMSVMGLVSPTMTREGKLFDRLLLNATVLTFECHDFP
jgi:hypothetical protein